MSTSNDPSALPLEQVAAPPSEPAPPDRPPPADRGLSLPRSLAHHPPPRPWRQQPASIPLPPIPCRSRRRPTPPSSSHRRLCLLDGALVALCPRLRLPGRPCSQSSTATSSSSTWPPAGLDIAQGEYRFGEDPFSFTAHKPWINHAWLYDLTLYAIHFCPPEGDIVLSVLKALLVAALALESCLASPRPRDNAPGCPPRALPSPCSRLVLRLFLQPDPRFLFLGLTVWLLVGSQTVPRRAWLIPPLCLFWVNLDAWFLLGPLAVALYTAGRSDRRFNPPDERDVRAPRRTVPPRPCVPGQSGRLLHQSLLPPCPRGAFRPGPIRGRRCPEKYSLLRRGFSRFPLGQKLLRCPPRAERCRGADDLLLLAGVVSFGLTFVRPCRRRRCCSWE